MVQVVGESTQYASLVPSFQFFDGLLRILREEQGLAQCCDSLAAQAILYDELPSRFNEIERRLIWYMGDTRELEHQHDSSEESKRALESLERMIEKIGRQRGAIYSRFEELSARHRELRIAFDQLWRQQHAVFAEPFIGLGKIPRARTSSLHTPHLQRNPNSRP
jgi:hypothetical protein